MRTFRTGEVADLCGVSPRLVVKWFDEGLLVGFRLPGSRDRRILPASLVEFMESNGMPVPERVKEAAAAQGALAN